MQGPAFSEPYNLVTDPDGTYATHNKEDAEGALEDEDRIRLFHVKAVLISGIGFFTDAYDLQVYSLRCGFIASSCVDHFQCPDPNGHGKVARHSEPSLSR